MILHYAGKVVSRIVVRLCMLRCRCCFSLVLLRSVMRNSMYDVRQQVDYDSYFIPHASN